MSILMNAVMDSVKYAILKRSAEAGQMTLGELVARLEAVANKQLPVTMADGSYVGHFHSYRGYYDHIALEPLEQRITVAQLLDKAKAAIGATFEGYKGGEFRMTVMTPVWISNWGKSSGIGLVAVEERPDRVLLRTKRIEDDE